MKNITIIIILLFSAIFIFACSGTSAVSGHVFDYDTGQPVSGALVTMCFSSEAPCPAEAADDTGITDEEGYYSVQINDEPVAGTYNSMSVIKDGYIIFSDNLNRMKDYDLTIYLKRQ